MKIRHLALSALLGGFALVAAATAAPGAGLDRAPAGPVILTVEGRIANGGDDRMVRFDFQKLISLGLYDISTTTPWTEGEVKFGGVSAAALMDRLGAAGERVVAIALNDYEATLPLSDFKRYGVMLALKQDGERMRVRDRGPIWIIYPAGQADHDDTAIRSRMVWQLKGLRVE